ncbi:MAG: hypothetical protein A3F31_02065 [Candidatus Levybacteria bacterium RIFCSPHIGHO2_12_FULL_38_12]|nr:MAG: hypothetical protein A2770_04020 [Candidatus Levybacteria bacterium RIFCSPHIGHO2_01_FULL_38_12]OGH22246.1 MAG: hypothetical protein A3F31_02065 [Candidatus Levybacteria bacterium RIFCSPHIGHO2_12_FULL_38_12]OGH44270.1 MAG: hypothetical protein A3J14_05445 [Candidatus Levybacteria bacterium RIFCSPLOWO2_02_FULL_37_18]
MQPRDAKPEVAREMGFFNEVIVDVDGGMQNNPLVTTLAIRDFLIRMHRKHKGWTQAQINDERYQRTKKAAQFAIVSVR